MNKEEYRDILIHDILNDENVTYKSLFGGYGFYIDGLIFAAYMDDPLSPGGIYLKADEKLSEELKKYGSVQFTYSAKSKPMKMSYWHVPDELLEQREILRNFIDQAWQVSKKQHKS